MLYRYENVLESGIGAWQTEKKKLRKKLNVTPKRHDRDFRRVWGGGTGEVLSMPLRQDRCHKAN